MNIWKLCMKSQVSRPFEDDSNRFHFLDRGSFVTKEDHIKAMEEQRKACARAYLGKGTTDKSCWQIEDIILNATIGEK